MNRHGHNDWFQSTPPRGGRPGAFRPPPCSTACFNPRPRAGGDWVDSVTCIWSEPRFQSTPPARGATHAGRGAGRDGGVSIHAPARGATPMASQTPYPLTCFNPRPRAGGDRGTGRVGSAASSFNPRPRAGGDASVRASRALAAVFQSTPPRGGRLRAGFGKHADVDVSIHAPARGATSSVEVKFPSNIVSIHAPARGATVKALA